MRRSCLSVWEEAEPSRELAEGRLSRQRGTGLSCASGKSLALFKYQVMLYKSGRKRKGKVWEDRYRLQVDDGKIDDCSD